LDKITKALLANKQVAISILDTRELVACAIERHKLSNTAAVVLGRTLTIGTYTVSNLKGRNDRLSITINGGGPIGNIVVAGTFGKIRGYVDNPDVSGDIASVVGKDGKITVIKDLGLKEPYNSSIELFSGNINNDMAYYYTVSEQKPTAIAVDVKFDNGKLIAAGGIIVHTLPECKDEIITMLQDIMTNFTDVGTIISKMSPQEIIDDYFRAFNVEYTEDHYPNFVCSCSKERIDKLILSLKPIERFEIIKETGKIEVHCEFCNTYYTYTGEDVEKLLK